MRRSNLRPAILISLGLHVALGLWLALKPSPAPVAAPAPLEATLAWVDVDASPPSPPPLPVARPVVAKKKKPTPARQPVLADAPIAAAEPAAPSGPAGEPASAPALASGSAAASGSTRPRLDLFPRIQLSPSGEFPVAPSHGHTLRPDDPSFSPEVIAAEEEHRVHERVSGWTDDTLADARAQRGLPHPYFTGVGEALKSGLDKEARAAGIGSSLTAVAASIGKRYAESLSSYGKTGNPDLGPPGITPRQSEQLQERFGSEPETAPLRALVQATELQEDLKHGRPLLSLTLEMRQSRELGTRTVAVLQGSGEASFDAFVVEVWPRALDQAGPPPPEAFHGSELRSVWAIEGWLGMPKKLERALSYLPTPGAMGIGADTVLPKLTKDGYHYEFRARLLRVY